MIKKKAIGTASLDLKKRKRRCEICGELKDGVERIINPYEEDLNGIIKEQAICHECYNALVADI